MGVYTIPMSDTVKDVVDGMVRRTVPRETLVQVIGPWVFDREALVDAMTRMAGAETSITDMMGLCEAAHVRVRVLPAP
ncbi:MAG TPA: 2-C-methyl-D-erythritol 4-phosphate cytidylyltransferase [Candidatus Dormibacteraeota bacterium]|nr:2-C-methyl-D-erythritol 4-phosphate cytidylyltransferase [Candidatus Dormibacteraeota bacterium]